MQRAAVARTKEDLGHEALRDRLLVLRGAIDRAIDALPSPTSKTASDRSDEQHTPEVATREQFAELVSVGRRQVGRWLKAGMPKIQLGRSKRAERIDVRAALAWLKAGGAL